MKEWRFVLTCFPSAWHILGTGIVHRQVFKQEKPVKSRLPGVLTNRTLDPS